MTWGIIAAVLFFVVHILGAIAKEAARRKELEKRREAEQRRQLELGRASGPVMTGPMAPEAASSTLRIESVPARPDRMQPIGTVDDLAARRKEQLEQLRQRRENRQVQRATVARPPADRGAVPADLSSSRVSRVDAVKAPKDQREQREREQAKARRLQEARAAQQRREAVKKAARERLDAERDSEPEQEAVRSEDQPAATRISHSKQVAGAKFRSKLKDRASLREIFILKEVIEAPLALRGDRNSSA
ncbi:MAG: hypothetical protein L0Y44_01075 [Phycisphaerales bacterium]|nr:hypothetical protein [Phycisphaerales bacterium]MCI0629231.1 hypothetical protein [Phycisphaerales bacterium]MCI0675888.1 hypothetical protein [Phycisphaerales bacterium]